jgi:hypothetical protein
VPVRTSSNRSLAVVQYNIIDLTIVFFPTTKALVQVESCFTVSKLYVRKPLCDNIEECSI